MGVTDIFLDKISEDVLRDELKEKFKLYSIYSFLYFLYTEDFSRGAG